MTMTVAERLAALMSTADAALVGEVHDPAHRAEIADALSRAAPSLLAEAEQDNFPATVAAALAALKESSPDWFDVELLAPDHARLLMAACGFTDWRSQLGQAVRATAEARRAEARQAKARLRAEGRPIPEPTGNSLDYYAPCDVADRFRNMEPRR